MTIKEKLQTEKDNKREVYTQCPAVRKKYDVISLFSGCGGLDLGIEGDFHYLGKKYIKNPFNVVWANDINKKATETYKLNFPNTNVVCGDITEILNINNNKQTNFFDNEINLPNADIIIGGFPCQDFSLAGKRKGLTVQRGNLYQSMVKAVEIITPKIFIAENVKGLISWENGLAIKTITEDFAKLGYKVDYKLFNAADFGVPQNRERVIILGIRNDVYVDFEWAKPTHTTDSWVTIKQAIDDLVTEDKHNSMPNCGYSKAKLFPGKQGNIKTSADKPAPTMRAEHHGNIEFHYSLPRRLSAREAARIQTFPDDFVFVSSTTDAYRQVGNAVAPVFAWHIAQMLRNILINIEAMEETKYEWKCI
ncbi:MAG: DNA cytosine methyltransferase [Oscillospiraceae bacterium]|nr:DNA cytosine methyltransferase [Oscillospiraceae bacterium]